MTDVEGNAAWRALSDEGDDGTGDGPEEPRPVMAPLESAVAFLRRRTYRIPAKDQRTIRRMWPTVTLLAAYRELSRVRGCSHETALSQ